jgi:uncharacterized protein YhhL (DUF1145 family)
LATPIWPLLARLLKEFMVFVHGMQLLVII